jgi:ketosteroid isomerase-like protein
MIGRNIISLSALASLGLALLPGAAIAQQSESDKVKAALDAQYVALSALDVGKMESVWAHDADAMLVNPRDKTVTIGWDAIRKNWEATFNNWSELKVTRTGGAIRISGNVAWATSVADVIGKTKAGVAVNAPTLSADVLEKRGDRWLVVSHNGWRIPQ